MASTFVSPFGGVACPERLSPHATTVPSFLSASAWDSPAETALRPDKFAGIDSCPSALSPQPITRVTVSLIAFDNGMEAVAMATRIDA
jgi:hypothetical protein